MTTEQWRGLIATRGVWGAIGYAIFLGLFKLRGNNHDAMIDQETARARFFEEQQAIYDRAVAAGVGTFSPLATVFGASQLTALFAALAATWSTAKGTESAFFRVALALFLISVLLLIASFISTSLRHAHHLALKKLIPESIRWTFRYEIDRVLEHLSTRGLYVSWILFAIGLCAIAAAVVA